MSTDALFWDKVARKYSQQPVKDMAAYEKTLERTRSYLGEDDTVLEVGCGTGSTALTLASAVGHITATDISATMIDIANEKRTAQAIENVRFLQAMPDTVPSDTVYDAVLAFNFLHLLRDPGTAVDHMAKVLKPGGVLITKTVCLADRHAYLRVLIFFMKLVGKAPYVNFLKIADLEKLFIDRGFQIPETGDYPASPPNHFIVARKG